MKKQILIIDDDSSIRLLLEVFLRDHFEIISKKNGLEGLLWLYRGNMPDLIMADIEMPVMDGLQLIRNIKKSGFFKSIPVIVLSGLALKNIRTKCLAEGASDFICKPFNPINLLENIKINLNSIIN